MAHSGFMAYTDFDRRTILYRVALNNGNQQPVINITVSQLSGTDMLLLGLIQNSVKKRGISLLWKIDMQETTDAVLKSPAYENANSDCKKALDTIQNCADVELSDYIKTCADIGSEQFKAELIATAIAQQLEVAR
ncbi:hypothetical protein Nmel_018415, partial [Mimus melanotis]